MTTLDPRELARPGVARPWLAVAGLLVSAAPVIGVALVLLLHMP